MSLLRKYFTAQGFPRGVGSSQTLPATFTLFLCWPILSIASSFGFPTKLFRSLSHVISATFQKAPNPGYFFEVMKGYIVVLWNGWIAMQGICRASTTYPTGTNIRCPVTNSDVRMIARDGKGQMNVGKMEQLRSVKDGENGRVRMAEEILKF